MSAGAGTDDPGRACRSECEHDSDHGVDHRLAWPTEAGWRDALLGREEEETSRDLLWQRVEEVCVDGGVFAFDPQSAAGFDDRAVGEVFVGFGADQDSADGGETLEPGAGV